MSDRSDTVRRGILPDMKIRDALQLPSLLFVAGALRKGSRLLDTLAYLLDPGGAHEPPESHPEDSGAFPRDDDAGGRWVEDSSPVVIPPEAEQMVSKPTHPVVPEQARPPLAGSIADRQARGAGRGLARPIDQIDDLDEILRTR